MFHTSLFYKIYEKLFMNNFLDLILDSHQKGNFKFSNNKLIVLILVHIKEPFQKILMKNLITKKN